MSTAPRPVLTDAPDLGDEAFAVPRAELTARDRDEMFDLLDRHFDGVCVMQFGRDLDEKDWALRIRRAGRLVGFSTLQVLEATHLGRPVRLIYSGDTIMAREVWGSPVLAPAWIALVREIQASRSEVPWYWLLLSSGFRTYRFLPVFWKQFWPRFDAPTPADEQSLLGAVAHQRFGDQFDRAAGVVRFVRPQRLRDPLLAVPVGRAADPHVRFFLSRNPGHAEGDELVCLTDLSDANLTAAGRRMTRGRSSALIQAGS